MQMKAKSVKDAFTDSIKILSGHEGEPSAEDFTKARKLMAHAAVQLPPARAKLAVLRAVHCGKPREPKDDRKASELIVKSATDGFPPSMRALAVLLLGSPGHEAMGAGLMRQAIQRGDWIAAFLLLREAGRGNLLARFQSLKTLSEQLSSAVPFREDIIRSVSSITPETPSIERDAFYKDECMDVVEDALKIKVKCHSESLNEHPLIETKAGVLSPLLCDYLIATSCGLMQPSKVVSDTASMRANYRTSDGAVLLPGHMDLVHAVILRRLSVISGMPPEHGEFLSLLRYHPGQEYKPHHDYLEVDAQDYAKIRSCGQRQSTLLTYLNDDFEGGETRFPELEIQYKGQAGDALYFRNISEAGRPVKNSLHAGLPVKQGEKWLATLWGREKPFWPWFRA